MLPVLLDLKFIKIYTFGIFLVLAFFWSSFLLWKNIRLTSYKEEDIFDGMFLSLFGGLFVGRLFYVLQHFDKFGFNIGKFILINGYPGLTLYGSLIGAIVGFGLFGLSRRISLMEIIDYVASPLMLAVAIGKLGSFFSGAEVGARTSFVLSIRYANFDGLRHLTPLYESILFFIGVFILYHLMFSIRRQNYRKGFSLYFFSWYFALVYLIVDRIKNTRYYIGGFSFNETLSAVIVIITTAYFIYYFRKSFTNLLLRYGQKNKQTIHNKSGEETEE